MFRGENVPWFKKVEYTANTSSIYYMHLILYFYILYIYLEKFESS